MTDDRRPSPPFPPQDLEPPGLERDMSVAPRYEAPGYRPAGKLQDRVALITGGDSGIGRAVALMFAREGADVAFTFLASERQDADITREAVERTGRRALPLVLDVTDPHQCEQVVQSTVERLGKLDILVNNAAYQNHLDSFDELSFSQWDKTFRTNVSGYFYMTKATLEHLRPGSVIINTGSVTGLTGSPGLVDYSATKGAIHAMTKSLAKALLPRGIRVNCVAPGPVWTPLNPAERKDEEVRSFGHKSGYGRPAQPEEVAPAFVFFASQDSEYISGEVLTLLGGQTRAG